MPISYSIQIELILHFFQPVEIPTYLIAIVSGDVRYKAFPGVAGRNWSAGIWAEPQIIDAAFWEFSEDTTRYDRA